MSINWKKSSRSNGQAECVEVANTADSLRDSKNVAGPVLRGNIPALLRAIRANQFDS